MPNSNISNLTVPPTTTMSAHIAASDPHPMYVLTDQLKAAVKTQISVSDLQDVIIDSDTTMNRTILIHNDGCWKPISVDDLLDGISLPVATTTKYGVAKLATYRDIAVSGSSTVVTPNLLIEYVSNALSDYQAPANYSYATTTTSGIVRLATNTDLTNRDQSAVVTPYLLRQYVDTLPRGSGTTTSVIVSAPLATHTVAGIAKLAEASDIVNSVTSMIVTPDLVAAVSNNISNTISAASSTLNASIINASSALNVSVTNASSALDVSITNASSTLNNTIINASSALDVAKQNVLTAANAGSGISISSTTTGVKINCTVQPGSGGSGSVNLINILTAEEKTNSTEAVTPAALVGSFINATMMGFALGQIKPFLNALGFSCYTKSNIFCLAGLSANTVHIGPNFRVSTTGGYYAYPYDTDCPEFLSCLSNTVNGTNINGALVKAANAWSRYRNGGHYNSRYVVTTETSMLKVSHGNTVTSTPVNIVTNPDILTWEDTCVTLPFGPSPDDKAHRFVIEFGRTRPIAAGDDYPHSQMLMKPVDTLLHCGLTLINPTEDAGPLYDLVPQHISNLYAIDNAGVCVQGFTYMAQRMWSVPGYNTALQMAYVAIGIEHASISNAISAEGYKWPEGCIIPDTSRTDSNNNAFTTKAGHAVISTATGKSDLDEYWGSRAAYNAGIFINSDNWYQYGDIYNGDIDYTPEVSSGQILRFTTLINQSLFLSDNCKAYSTVVNSGGLLYMDSTASAIITDIHNSGKVVVERDGLTSRITVYPGGYLEVHESGIASDIIENGGYVSIHSGANAEFSSCSAYGIDVGYSQSATIHENTSFMSLYVDQNADVSVFSGGYISDAFIHGNVSIYTSSEIIDYEEDISRIIPLGSIVGSVTIYSDGYLENPSINKDTILIISEGGQASGIRENGGFVSIADNANAYFNDNIIDTISLYRYSGAVLSATVHSGTIVSTVELSNNAQLYVFSGGVVSSAIVNNGCAVFVCSSWYDHTDITSTIVGSGVYSIDSEGNVTSIING